MTETLDSMFSKLVKESKAFQAKEKKSKPKQRTTGKTFSESRKRRERRTINNLLAVKERINGEHDKIIEGSLKKTLIEAIVHKEICSSCGATHRQVQSVRIWSKATRGEHLNPWRMTQEVRSLGMLQCNKDLPWRKIERTVHISACASCVDKHLETNLWKPE